MSSYPEILGEYALILLGGEITDLAIFQKMAATARIIVCADSGAKHARLLDLNVDVIVGDLDSISKETLEYYRERGSEIVQMAEQESDDFEKALRYLNGRFKGYVRILGISGNRTDHMLTNFSVMLRYSDSFESLVAYDDSAEHQFLTAKRNNCSITCPVGTTISLTPFGEAIGVTTQNLRYPLISEDLRLGEREGLSNVATGTPITITIVSGALLVTVNSLPA